MSNPAEIVVLAEDVRQFRLVRAWVGNRVPSFPMRNIHALPMSNGRGSGEQRVLLQYEIQVLAHLTRHARKWLIVVIDADNLTVQDRLNQLAQQLRESEDGRVRGSNADLGQVARIIPKWSIETWILFLNGENVDEDTRYKNENREWDQLIKPAALRLSELTAQANPPEDCVPSLAHGVGELRKLSLED